MLGLPDWPTPPPGYGTEIPKMPEPIIVPGAGQRGEDQGRIAASGRSFGVYEWSGSGPAYLHVHHADDEAWYVLEGTLRFRLGDRQVDATAGATVFVPAGVAHSYEAVGTARYLIILTPRLRDLIAELHGAPDLHQHQAIMRRYQSEILE
jgi:mannose-6-phosphate isomerase-like protein (cupin superfamily)